MLGRQKKRDGSTNWRLGKAADVFANPVNRLARNLI